MSGPTAAQIASRIDSVLAERPDARTIAISAAKRCEWPPEMVRKGRRFTLRWADSTLAVRDALATLGNAPAEPGNEHPNGLPNGLVLLTPLPATSLGSSLLARLDRGKVHATDRWQTVRDAFQARDVDPRLRRHGWMADILLERIPSGGYPPVSGGVLDIDTAWRHLLRELLDFESERGDVDALLRWTTKGDGPARFAALEGDARDAVRSRVAAIGGLAPAIMALVASGYGGLALPLGLLIRVLFDPASRADPDLATARGRMELYTGGHAVDTAEAASWAEAAERVLDGLSATEPMVARRWLDRADQLAQELRVGPHVATSRVLLSGFTARLARAAETLDTALREAGKTLPDLERAVQKVREHAQQRVQSARCERLAMAVRLVRWLARPMPSPATGLAEAARRYAEDGAFVDWARRSLAGGDDLAALSTAYGALADRVRARRETETAHFAGLLRDWSPAPSPLDGIVPMEAVLEEIVAPLARLVPVLLLVLDGMSLAVFRELLPRLTGQGWVAHGPPGQRRELFALAPLPSVTEICRTSLFTGRVQRGDQATERQGFSSHPALTGASRNRRPPVLYHKRDLTDGATGMLSGIVRATVGTPDHRVVAIVYNAVDDQLDGAEQIHLRWSVDNLPLLSPLLHEARCAGRVVVLTADHGHVPEDGTALPHFPDGERSRLADGDRWRRVDGPPPGEGELLLTGPRILAPHGASRVIGPWSERLRYAGKKNGYHGGLSPQEVVVPLAVLAPADDMIPEWQELPPVEPDWWEGCAASPSAVRVAAPPAKSRRKQPAAPTLPTQSTLFDRAPETDWIAAVLSCETYRVQRRLAGERLPDDTQVRSALEALAERGGHWTRVALAQRLQVPMIRLGGLLAQLRRLLNVDGYPVLAVDEAAATVTFDRRLLEVQFMLGTPP